MNGNFPERDPDARRPDDELVDYLLGDLPPADAARLEQRLADDSLLRVELYECRRVIDAMRALPAAHAGPGFVASVMAARHRDAEALPPAAAPPRHNRRAYAQPLMAMAAALVIIAGGMLAMLQPQPAAPVASTVVPQTPPAPARSAAIETLRAAQLPNGAWDTGTGGGTWNARPGLTALVLCGLIQTSAGECFTGPDADIAARALDYLIRVAQETDHHQRALVVHRQQLAFVGVALSEAQRLCRDPAKSRRIELALAALNIDTGSGSPRIASAILPHLPEQAARQGGHIYQLARALLLETSS